MNFTKLRLTGFKSFVDPTEMNILPGLTGIVGPNGCGKSNLLEGLRWVMGENRPTSMRGGGMEDVIFAGSGGRPARSYAEVVLSIEGLNTESFLPIHKEGKLELVRRISLDSGSTYKVDGKEVRGRDVRMLFADSSTGAHSPSLVRQGEIASLIHANPKSRRRVLEEAAGISGIYQRRHESELKLKAAETNLERVDDILDKLEIQIKSLENQAKQANKYRKISEEIRQSEALLLYVRWDEKNKELISAQSDFDINVRLAAELQNNVLRLSKIRISAEEIVPKKRMEEASAAARLRQLLVSEDRLIEQAENAERLIVDIKNRIDIIESDCNREISLAGDADIVMTKLVAERTELREIDSEFEKDYKNLDDGLESTKNAEKHCEQAYDELAESLAKDEAKNLFTKQTIADAKNTLKNNEKAIAEILENEVELQQKKKKIEASQASVFFLLKTNASEAEELRKNLKSQEEFKETAISHEFEARANHSEAQSALKALGAEIKFLEDASSHETGDRDGLIDTIKVVAGYEAAVGAILSEELKYPELKEGDETLTGWIKLPTLSLKPEFPKEVEPLSNFVDAPTVLNRKLSYVGIVDRSIGLKLQKTLTAGQYLVSKQGDMWRWDGFKMDSYDLSSTVTLRLEQKNRLTELKKQHFRCEKQVSEKLSIYEKQKLKMAQLEDDYANTRSASVTADERLASAKLELSTLSTDLEVLRGEFDQVKNRKDRVTRELEDSQKLCNSVDLTNSEFKSLEKSRKQVEEKKDELYEIRRKVLEQRLLLDQILNAKKVRDKRIGELTNELLDWQNRSAAAVDRKMDLEKRKHDYEIEFKKANLEPNIFENKLKELRLLIIRSESNSAEASNFLVEAERALKIAVDEERKKELASNESRQSIVRIEVLLETVKNALDQLVQEIDESTGQTPEKLLEYLGKRNSNFPSFQLLEGSIEKLTKQRDSLGPVNLRAEQDQKEIITDFENLSTDKIDLEKAVKKLRKAILDLNSDGRRRLLEAFDSVNKNFQNLFEKLFGGGKSDLMLVEGDDPLEAGLEIMCQPPGKKLTGLSLLSGGEQTLAAISLIFAVFLANPSPVCVLDEVDAPLDDANVNKFCDLLNEMSKKTETRFLVITHHPITMSRMSRLFGVTMAEKGVSQLVSVDLEQAEELTDAG